MDDWLIVFLVMEGVLFTYGFIQGIFEGDPKIPWFARGLWSGIFYVFFYITFLAVFFLEWRRRKYRQ